MSIRNQWRRVNRAKPCPICKRPDWCLVSEDGGAAICARIESARRAGDARYLHRLRDDDFRPRHRIHFIPMMPVAPAHDLADLAAEYRRAVDPVRLNGLAAKLELSVVALDALGIGWSSAHGAWSFPMTDVTGVVRGIRLRKPDGFKFSVKGGKEGLFIPPATPIDAPLFVVEGATDAAALLDFGLVNVVGRPSCTGGIKLVVDLVKARKPRQVILVADGDEPGQRGAGNLASVLLAYASAIRLISPPRGLKDVRAWRQAGSTHAELRTLVDAAPVRKLTIRSSSTRQGR